MVMIDSLLEIEIILQQSSNMAIPYRYGDVGMGLPSLLASKLYNSQTNPLFPDDEPKDGFPDTLGDMDLPTGNNNGIAVYSSLLNHIHQPSGTCNFSRIDNAQLVTTGDYATGNSNATNAARPNNIYAVNYNVLRIMSGMGGLAYSN